MANRKQYTKDRKYKNDRMCSLEEVAQELGVTPERVRIIERNALTKCKAWCKKHDYEFEELMSVLSKDNNIAYKVEIDYAIED